jgi:transposase-like protein
MAQSNDSEERAQHPLRYPLQHCPTCGSDHLESVVEFDTLEVHSLCRDCKRCWHVELGHVHRMSPDACHGCPHLSECRPVFAADRHQGVHAWDA